MSKFTTPADVRLLGRMQWEILAEFDYYLGDEVLTKYAARLPIGGVVVRVPVGTITDLASVPRILWSIFPPHDIYAKAAIIHDYLYDKAIGSKAFADDVFNEAMAVLGVPTWRRVSMYWAVRLFGRGNYSNPL
jgi:Protein of unknown function (DUF1353)